MKPIVVLYATREGQTRRIATWLTGALRERGVEVDCLDVARLPRGFLLAPYRAAVLCASVHATRHEREMVDFARVARATLATMPTALVSVSLSEAGAEDASAPAERRAKAAADVKRMIDGFLDETGLRPMRVLPVAGSLAYREYNFILRFVMKRIARSAGATTDTSRDHELTDWKRLEDFAATLAADLEEEAAPFIEPDDEEPQPAPGPAGGTDGGGATGPNLSG